jgi:hypothetical protein
LLSRVIRPALLSRVIRKDVFEHLNFLPFQVFLDQAYRVDPGQRAFDEAMYIRLD